MGHRRQVVDGVGPVVSERLPHGAGIGDVGPLGPVEPDDRVTASLEVLDERPSDEPAGPGDEGFHRRPHRRRGGSEGCSSATFMARR